MRGYYLPPTKPMLEEDVIADVLSEEVYREKMIKCRDIIGYKQEMRKADPSFKGFILMKNTGPEWISVQRTLMIWCLTCSGYFGYCGGLYGLRATIPTRSIKHGKG